MTNSPGADTVWSTFLTRILAHKHEEIERQQIKIPLRQLEDLIARAPAVRDFAAALRQPERVALIAEIKKASPSRGVLIEHFDPLALAGCYAENGAAAISVLTDLRFFQGSIKYIEAIRNMQASTGQHVPLLRKDFILDRYQVLEARAYGADALLLIVAALDDHTLADLLHYTKTLGMQALVEVHDPEELARALAAGATIIGVNNRNLHSFETNLNTTQLVAQQLATANRPILVSESGIFTREHIALLRSWGADAVLIGEALVTASDIAERVRELSHYDMSKL